MYQDVTVFEPEFLLDFEQTVAGLGKNKDFNVYYDNEDTSHPASVARIEVKAWPRSNSRKKKRPKDANLFNTGKLQIYSYNEKQKFFVFDLVRDTAVFSDGRGDHLWRITSERFGDAHYKQLFLDAMSKMSTLEGEKTTLEAEYDRLEELLDEAEAKRP